MFVEMRLSLSVVAAAALAAGFARDVGLQNVVLVGDALPRERGVQYLDSSSWIASSASASILIQATVPGDLISDLQHAGEIGDPYYENNFLNSSVWNAPDWTYTGRFAPNPDFFKEGTRAILVFESVKQGASLSINGVLLGNMTNQFVRYTFDVTSHLSSGTEAYIVVSFDSGIDTHGRFMACTGGWDWAPWSHTWDAHGAPTFSKGIVGSVYLLPTKDVILSAFTAHTFYLGEHATKPLQDGKHEGFSVQATAHISVLAQDGVVANFEARGGWSSTAVTKISEIVLPPGEHKVILRLNASATDIQLWWPNGLGAQALYPVSLIVKVQQAKGSESVLLHANRSIGFRSLAWVTGNDTDYSFIAQAKDGDGSASPTFTTFLRVNGARIFARGSNMVPLDELEARVTSAAYRKTVLSAAAAGMNMLRVWSGGLYYPDSFYNACDMAGVLVYHDLMFAQEGHSPCCPWYGPCWYGRCDVAREQTRTCTCNNTAGASIELELRQQVRRLSSHPSLVIYDAVNEAAGFGLYSSFVMPIVAEEDASRILWAASPSQGWSSGVHTLSGLPNGLSLRNQKWCDRDVQGSCPDAKEVHGPYDGAFGVGGFNIDTGNYTPAMPAAMAMGGSGPGPHPPTPAPLFDPPMPPTFLTPADVYWGGSDSQLSDIAQEVGLSSKGFFVSEFGVPAMSSFESLAPSFSKEHRGVHTAPFHRRSHNSDGFVNSYFGPRAAVLLDEVSDRALRGQVYLSMLSQGLHLTSRIETFRAANIHGALTWDLGEIWPTAGWGTLEYGSSVKIPGAVEGGRWKPGHYALRDAFSDVIASCGFPSSKEQPPLQHLVCYLRNDSPWAANQVRVSLSLIHLQTGNVTDLHSFTVDSLAPVAELASTSPAGHMNSLAWFCLDSPHLLPSGGCAPLDELLESKGCSATGADCLLNMTISKAHGSTIVQGVRALAPPAKLQLPEITVTAAVIPSDGMKVAKHPQVVVKAKGGVALWVVLSTLAQGRFSDNVFFVRPGHPRVVDFLPLDPSEPVTTEERLLLQTSLQFEHLSGVMHEIESLPVVHI